MQKNKLLTYDPVKGGEWLIRETDYPSEFIPEDFSEEQVMIKEMCRQFMDSEIMPRSAELDKNPTIMPDLLQKSADLGLLSVGIPEEYGGLEKDFITQTIVMEELGKGYSFSVAYVGHCGIGTLPILYFGNEKQRSKYIPKLASGTWTGAYGLTEPNSGSDALGSTTTATLSEDGKYYILNGQKCWITNGGFADVFTVFAKIDGTQFTAFIVEKGFEGFFIGEEEHKMGIKGSSTVQLFFQDCKVPVENVLGEKGRGHIIAFNILNVGRFKLCAATVGSSKNIINLSLTYATERIQFKRPIASFGAIKYKLAQMAIFTWVAESAAYRTAQLLESKKGELVDKGLSKQQASLGAAEEYATECAILKVFGSEMLDYCVDEGLQIHGGNGFSDEYEISKAYRDSRINRIFEGTNEINRLLIVDMLLKKAAKGDLNLAGAVQNIMAGLQSGIEKVKDAGDGFARMQQYVRGFKKAILVVAGAVSEQMAGKLESEQQIVMNIADMIINTYISESAVLRLLKYADLHGEASVAAQVDIVETWLVDAADAISKAAKDAIYSFGAEEQQIFLLKAVSMYTKTKPFNVKEARKRIAEKMSAEQSYCF